MRSSTLTIILACSSFYLSCSSQYTIKDPTEESTPPSQEELRLIQIGTDAYDRANYDEARKIYRDVLRRNPNNSLAMYELALTLSALNEHQQSVDLCFQAMQYQSTHLNQVYLLAGTELDMLGKSKDAANVYRDAINRFPQDYMLHYNLGVTNVNLKNTEEAKAAFKSSIALRPSHASSHYALGTVLSSEENNIPALLAFSRFLILEPNSNRAQIGRDKVRSLLSAGVRKDPTKTNQINVSFNPNQPNTEGDFASVTLFLSLKAASHLGKEQKAMSEAEELVDSFTSLFSMLDETARQEKHEGFAWRYYVPYFVELKKQGHINAFVDCILQQGNHESDAARNFLRWSEGYAW